MQLSVYFPVELNVFNPVASVSDPLESDSLNFGTSSSESGPSTHHASPPKRFARASPTAHRDDVPSTSDGRTSPLGSSTVMSGDPEFRDPESGLVEANRVMHIPLLIRESTDSALPVALTDAYQQTTIKTNHDALLLVLDVLMNETGFICEV